jgi:TP901 family phage tail tape measure protein
MSDIIISVDGDTRPLEAKLGKISARTVNLNLKDSLSQPLGRITGKVSEFQKSLEASNARVLAFGASAGAIYTVQKAFSEIVKSTIEVEKSLADINVVLNTSSKDLGKFGSSLFGIAKSTGQSFDQVSKAATEFARQGLGVAETLKRTSDALILSRLSGLDAARSVETLTAAVNSFARAGLTSTQIINKLANVDASFAVSTGDLAEAISRVGSTAQDVGVDLDQLIALVTSAQQTTARGGAVIGNSFKTIFTRIQRADTLDALEGVGVAVRDLQGNVLPAMQVLDNLAKTFGKLTQAQQASIAEDVGGVFQINILRAALSDLGKEYNVYNSALGVSRTATDQAIKRNEALNQTLSALTNKTFVNLKEAAAKVGEITIAPTIKGGLGGLNVLLEEFNKPQESQGIGTQIATGILSGIGNYISGPGLAVVGAAFIKIFGGLTKFSAEALKSLIGISSQADKIAAAQERVNTILAQNPSLIQAIISKESSLLQIENQILKIIQSQNAARAVGASISARVAPAAAALPIPTVKTKTKAGGHIPNFSAAAAQEIMGAYAGGYTPGAVKKTNGMYYNTAESVVQFPGASGPAIIPPENSDAGKNYKKQFQRSAGFNPYASNGFIPNFADKPPADKPLIEDTTTNTQVGMIYPKKAEKPTPDFGIAEYVKGESKQKVKIKFLKSGYNVKKGVKPKDVELEKQLGDYIVKFTNNFASRIFQGSGQQPKISSIEELSNKGAFRGVTGAVFESAVGLATGSLNEGRSQNAPIDFAAPTDELRKLFNGLKTSQYEAKVNDDPAQRDSVAQKILNLGLISGGLKGKIAKQLGSDYQKETKKTQLDLERHELERIRDSGGKLTPEQSKRLTRLNSLKKIKFPKASAGFIPNFSALQDAISREKAAGISSSQIRVGADSTLMNKNNPFGLGVYNTKDEPAGLKQGINRSRGNIPNFARPVATPGAGSIPVPEMKKLKETTTSLSEKMVVSQGRLMALSFGLSTAQGIITQFGSETNKVTKGLSQSLGVMSTVASGFSVGGKKYGGAIAGTMVAAQGIAGLSESANKPYTTQIDSLNKTLDVMRTKSGQLESVMSSLTPTINEYIAELDKSEPDPAKISDFKKAILEGIAPLGKEMQDKIIQNLSAPKEVQAALSKEQRGGAVEQSQKELTRDIYQKQLNARKQMGFQGQVGQILSVVPGLGGVGKRMMEGQGPKNTLGTQQDMEGIASNLLAPLSQTPQDLAFLAESLSSVSGNTNDVIAVLKMMAQSAGISTEAIDAVNGALAESPAQANQFAQALFGSINTSIKKAKALAEQGAGEGGISRNYKGAGKILTKESVQGQGNEPSLKAQMAEQTAIYNRAKKIGPAAGIFQDTSSSTMVDLLTKSGIGLDTIKQTNPKLYESLNQGYQNKLKENMTVQEEAIRSSGGDVEAFKKIMGEKYKDPREFADAAIQENYGDQAPDLKNMGQTFIAQTAAQAANTEAVKALTAVQEQAAAGAANAKNATFDANQASRMGTQVPGAGPDYLNTALAAGGLGGGIISSAIGGALGGGVANVSTKAVGGALNVGKNVVGGAVNVGKNVVGGIGGGFGAARGALNTAAAANGMNIGVGEALALPGGALTTAALGVGAFAGGAALGYGAGELVDPGAEKRTAMLESIPGVKTGFKSLSSVLPSFLGGGGAEGPSQEDEAKTTEMFNRAKEKQKQRLQRQQAVSEAPTVEVPENQLKEVQKTASTEKAQQNQITNTISVSPTISIAQQAAANDKADLQKMIEAEVKKFGEGLLKIVEEKSKNTAKGTVTPPQSMRAQMAA